MGELIDIPKLFGENLKRLRKERNLTQAELAERLDVSQKHLSVIETGTQFASAALIAKIAQALDVIPAELFGGVSSETRIINGITAQVFNMMNPRLMLIQNSLEELKKQGYA